jgi:hypothetical protein
MVTSQEMCNKYEKTCEKINSTYASIEESSNSPKEFAANVQMSRVIPPILFLMKKQNITDVKTLLYVNFEDVQVQKWMIEACNKLGALP